MYNIFHEDITDQRLSFIYKSPIYSRSKIAECDFIIHNRILWDESVLNTETILKQLSTQYKEVDRFILVFIVSDYEDKYQFYNNIIVNRTSVKASRKKNNEIVLPYLWEYLPEPFAPIINLDKPSIGFCGLLSKHREKLIKVFKKSTAVRADFIIRDKFWGGAPHNTDIINDFNTNIKQNPFIIAQRGNGNFSMRFYQTLSAGRIPVLVNTDMALPFKDEITWNDYIVFEKNEKACLKKVIEVFESGKYIEMQQNCQKLFKLYFSEYSFFEQSVNQIIRMYPAA